MQYPAQVQAAIEVLGTIATSDLPADRLLADYFKNRRYIGGKDKKAISGLIYQVLRRWGEVGWLIERVGGKPTDRLMVAAYLARYTRPDMATIFTGEHYQPKPLKPMERQCVTAITKLPENIKMPAHAAGNVPQWLLPLMENAFGADTQVALEAMNQEAPLDVRTNTLKTTPQKLREALTAEGLELASAPYSPQAVRLVGRHAFFTLKPFKEGWFEVQDTGSQIVAALCPVKPGQRVIDFCAGAGGKTLALAAAMQNKGRLVSCDVLAPKLDELKKRLRRAGVDNAEVRPVTGAHDVWVKRQDKKADVVLLDVPCSGTGVWRRNPDAKWKLAPERLEALMEIQADILNGACRMVKPGGYLVYATCSVLPEENDQQIDAFLLAHEDFTLVPVADIWQSQGLQGACPAQGKTLTLAPHAHDTDGFFVAVMRRHK